MSPRDIRVFALVLSLVLTIGLLVAPPSAAGDPDMGSQLGNISITFRLPNGDPLEAEKVVVYLQPDDPPCSFVPPVLAQGIANSSGQFSFDLFDAILELKAPGWMFPKIAADSVVNAKILAIDPQKQAMVWHNAVLPVFSALDLALSPNVVVSETHRDATAAELLSIDLTTVASTQDDPDPADPPYEAAESISTDGRAGADRLDQPSTHSLDDCFSPDEPAPGEVSADPAGAGGGDCWGGCVVAKSIRWGKVADQHSDIGIHSKFTFEVARETVFGVAFKRAGRSWSAAGESREAKLRGTGRTKKLTGDERHKVLRAPYVWYKWKDIQSTGCCGPITTYEWRTNHWDVKNEDGFFDWLDGAPVAYRHENLHHDERLHRGESVFTHTQNNKYYAGAVSIVGLELMGQVGYSSTTKVEIIAAGDCITTGENHRYVFGAGVDVQFAPVLYTESNCR